MVIRLLTILVAAGYVPPWEALDVEEQPAMRATTAEVWRQVLALTEATDDEIRAALMLWIARDTAGFWPKPGAVAALIVRGARPAQIEEVEPAMGPELEAISAASQYESVNRALYWGPGMGKYWPPVDLAVPEHRAAADRMIAAKEAKDDREAANLIRHGTAARRLLGVRMVIEQLRAELPIPDDSIEDVVVGAMIQGQALAPTATREGVREWIRDRMARDAEIRAQRDAEIAERLAENQRRIKEKANPAPRRASPPPAKLLERVGTRPPPPAPCSRPDDV